MEDAAYAATPLPERHVFAVEEGQPKRVDHEFYLRPWGELVAMESSTLDLDHYPVPTRGDPPRPHGEACRPVPAAGCPSPSGTRHPVVGSLPGDRVRPRPRREMSGEGQGPCRAAHPRGGKCGACEAPRRGPRLVGPDPPLGGGGAPHPGRAGGPPGSGRGRPRAPSPDGFNTLREGVQAFLDELGESFHHDRMALIRWAFLTAEGKAAFRTWGAR